MHTPTFFLHGLDSSSRGTKGRYFTEHFEEIVAPDFAGNLQERLQALDEICVNLSDMVMIGSSFGGLMATCFAIAHPKRVTQLILLAPALNFDEFIPPEHPLHIPTVLIIGNNDTVTPPDLVIPAAQKTFLHLDVACYDDDHLLHSAFFSVDWKKLLT